MDSFFELIFGSLYDKFILKLKKFKAQIIFVSYSKQNSWINNVENNQTYKKAIINNENLLNLFIDGEFRNDDLKDIEKRNEYIKNIINDINK